MIKDIVRNKNVLLAFSDPAGAKSLLSFAKNNRDIFSSVVAISDRQHGFYPDFGFEVEAYEHRTPEEWLAYSRADVLVTGTSFPLNLEAALIDEASRLGITSFVLVDYWVNFRKRFQAESSLILPTWICVIDERARRLAIAEGLPSERILITGNPYHDFMASWKPKLSRFDFLVGMGLPVDAVYVLYAPEPITSFGLQDKYGFTELDGIQVLYEAMRPILSEKMFLIIKGHPNQNDEVFEEFVSRQLDCQLLYSKGFDINMCSWYSECVVGFFSNSLLEANLLGKPVIRPLMMMSDGCVDPIKELESSNFTSYYEEEKFVAAIQDIGRHFPCRT